MVFASDLLQEGQASSFSLWRVIGWRKTLRGPSDFSTVPLLCGNPKGTIDHGVFEVSQSRDQRKTEAGFKTPWVPGDMWRQANQKSFVRLHGSTVPKKVVWASEAKSQKKKGFWGGTSRQPLRLAHGNAFDHNPTRGKKSSSSPNGSRDVRKEGRRDSSLLGDEATLSLKKAPAFSAPKKKGAASSSVAQPIPPVVQPQHSAFCLNKNTGIWRTSRERETGQKKSSLQHWGPAGQTQAAPRVPH
ncbi:hypothetical protein GWK47_019284 [Chionoecetes opilio]|uniref:Uncharacterized protein n=1 Tax=Chionoecetes opilio TaxID=41210 RepID=A0A8J4XZ18_CHIOP|nr:hypothetical protein GWK47_019284 [Chionoecetes opilio]